MRDLNDMALFALIVEAGTLTTAAIRAGPPKSTVARRLARLEARLGVRLIERGTRRLRITEAGEAYDEVSQRKRKLIETTFGWLKQYGGLRRPMVRDLARMSATVTLAATAFNLLRMRNLLAGAAG
ncbi:MAG TPA: LysR family transcriptional regulator [Candidatus Macondimonas sp.]|nr:LysR family transcriptional regulator [Candidatus Macondimonas sp.]